MGFFKDIKNLKEQANEIGRNAPPVKDRMADALGRMHAANTMMVNQTATATLAASGHSARATVTTAAPTGVTINMQHVYRLEVLVFPQGGAPFPSIFEGPVAPHLMGLCLPGASVEVSYDPTNTASVFLAGPSF